MTPWLNPSMIHIPRFALMASEADFRILLNKMGVESIPPLADSVSCTHRIYTKEGQAFIVGIDEVKMRECGPVQQMGVLIHEAVHVFQYFCEMIGERNPSPEFEAYSIQHLAEELMLAYRALTNPIEIEIPA